MSRGLTGAVNAAIRPIACGAIFAATAATAGVPSRSIGLVVTDVRYALYETPDAKEECPDGLQVGEVTQFKAMPNLAAHMAKFGGTIHNRGPNGELSNFSPLMVEDPIPFRELKTSKGLGLNLDGTQDGRATPLSLQHDKFVSPDGEKVDNQMARVLGCVMGWRKTGFMAEFYANEVVTSPHNRFLVEITGVDDERNDPDVVVAVYKGIDRLLKTPDGNGFIPMMSHRIDKRATDFTFRTRGRIVEGVLITEPIPMLRMAMRQIEILGERRMRDARFRLNLAADGAEGFMGGYEPLDTWWNITGKGPGSDPGRYSPSLLYRAALRYADGYPDPKTGKATAISVAYRIKAVRAMIVHSNAGDARIASAAR